MSRPFFYNVFRSYFLFLPDLGKIANYSFGMLGLITAFMIANQMMEKLYHFRYTLIAGLTAICVYMMFIKPEFTDGNMLVSFDRFGPAGILLGIVTGMFVSYLFHLYTKLGFLKESSLPDFVVGWIHAIIPILISIGCGTLLVFTFDIDVFSKLLSFFSPIAAFGQTLPGFILMALIPAIAMSMGISVWTFTGLQMPIFMLGITANIALVAAGHPPTNIVTYETLFTAALITMGGTGATLALNLLMLFSKSKELKTTGYICIGPSFFNINEPLVFGTPIVLNPLLMLPMWINAITSPIIVWIFMRSDWLNIPSKMIQVGQIPAPFSSVIITEDWRAIICYAVLMAVFLITWYPFFKVYEKKRIEEESANTSQQD
ncbi:PTS transporter subunit EIIC [Xenorhabdus griffiniae]|uniref:PTS transporter subunit EIIC n=1 Tax=Xenorhabdus griffiniae TaxID=351672 RepID=A0ABY9XG37_9GAMM|nr:PTS transporter subunit EIIC [Xenorhabdus griffiniae]MBD1226395.1 PTS sugar transporter subunit IIC [Xenorhabdus griffiniae]MBE8588539.1 PTS sugar transporter subunit IIC [Xenorhabdus griffiniae]WMV71858.1 PTS transporter subunit EIIC [Xenorhabdus griffiniae]WNH01535.1 PTS transporter subunit EIIC [Xenorhabdus griffiniae]